MPAKTQRERKRKERERLRTEGITVVRFKVSAEQKNKLNVLCNETVRPGDSAFTYDELMTVLLEKAYKEFTVKLTELKKQSCKRCGKELPADCARLFYGDNDCYLTSKCKALSP